MAEKPNYGERCPRCHIRAPKPTRCALCNPEGETMNKYEVGDVVRYWKMLKEGKPNGEGAIKQLGVVGGTEVAWISGCRGAIALTHIEDAG